ncbi:MAG: protein translocase subunit SecF [Bacteriovoracaceae bacterium]|jgi:preprotein translocase subunit SecF|nr:protein translocase subunit SecF [Bacteriovoracaceae bacterium]
MFEIIKSGTKIKFTGMFRFTAPISILLVLVSLYLAFGKGLEYGVDFRGGAEIQVKFSNAIETKSLRSALTSAGYGGALVQTFGVEGDNEYLIKVKADEKNLNGVTDKISSLLVSTFSGDGVEIRKTDIVGPKAGAELRNSGFLAMFYALLAIMIYIAIRFDFKYSPGAIFALFHDVSIILGILSLSSYEFSLQTVAALLAVIGYSVNDTVVVYDRVREHEEKYAGRSLKEHIDNAINETLSRTILTSFTTLFVSLAMFFFGGVSIEGFFFTISLGVIIGTYSSIFVAAPITLLTDKLRGTGGTVEPKAS